MAMFLILKKILSKKELDPDYVPDEKVKPCPLAIEIEKCDPMEGAATTPGVGNPWHARGFFMARPAI